MKITFCIIALVFAIANFAPAQEYGTITGKIVDAYDNVVIPGAIVEIVNTDLKATSTRNGKFKINNIPEGLYTVKIRMMGYNTIVIDKIIVSKDENTNLEKIKMKDSIGRFVTFTKDTPLRIKKDQTQTIYTIPAEEIEHTPKK